MILPARRSFYLLAAHSLLALVVSIQPVLLPLWWLALAVSALVLAIDAWRIWRQPALLIERHVPPTLAVGLRRMVTLHIKSPERQAVRFEIYDHHPASMQAQGLPLHLSLPAGELVEASYSLQPNERGPQTFTQVQYRLLSPWQFWWHDRKQALVSPVRVYPNFTAIAQYALLATDHQLSQMGIIKRRRRGEGQDFHQLREYREGDSLRQIDWKASARMQKAISREYQDERDQEIIFLIDSGHRMLAKDDDLSHFDHTLNAMILLAYVALKQGDAVGLGTFGGNQRWLKPLKGQASLNQILNAAYDLQATSEAPDYSQVATELLVRQKKRALIILITNLRDEDTADLLPALNLLRKRHLVLLASMREVALTQTLHKEVQQLEQAIEHAAVLHYLQLRQKTLERVRATGIHSLDVLPSELSTQLINRYMDIKRSGAL